MELANAPGPYVGVLHPVQIADLRTAVEASSSGIFTGGSVRGGSGEIGTNEDTGFFGNFMGIDWYQSPTVPTANTAAGRAGGAFSKDCASGMIKKLSLILV